MSRRNEKYENWLLLEWTSGGREVVHVNTVLSPSVKDLKVGVVMTLPRRGERDPQTATLIARARDRDHLSAKSNEEIAGPSLIAEDEAEDFSPSGSSWAPSGEDDSDNSDHECRKKIKLENCTRQYINRRSSKKIMTPSHRANPVIPKIMQDALSKNNNVSRKRAHNGNIRNTSFNKSLPDSTKRNNTTEINGQTVTIDARELASISNSFRVLFRMIEELKRPMSQTHNPMNTETYQNTTENVSQVNETVVQAVEECEETEEYENEEFNRSDDNVLITNKYDNQYNASASMPVNNQYKSQALTKIEGAKIADSEWVPIGSGKTLIHVDQFRKVNWKSYTVATRTLLLAVFPRRILATHCLTGKKSPAFLNKPAKMCLDPKIISDVIIEIMDRFDVKENLVRGIITTKCADECKMWKQRAKKKSSQSRSSSKSSNQENEPPAKATFEQSNHVPTHPAQ